tara:strand:+ start:361 stop:741 length:381 start_codon:yes stop_codon:yes gene_type:complete
MNSYDKKKKSTRELKIDHLNRMIWLSTPLGKFLGAIQKQTAKVLPSLAVPTQKRLREWVVRLPCTSLGYKKMGPAGFQTIVHADSSIHALEQAAECDVWDVLDIPITRSQVFLKDPVEDEQTKGNE